MTEEELKRVIEIYGEDYDVIDIPTYIRKRDENEARALSQMEEEWRQEKLEREEREKFDSSEL
jgi:hypothetical protein